MKIAITGASGLIGSALVERLSGEGHSLLLFSRNPSARRPDKPEMRHFQVDLMGEFSPGYLEGVDALVNLAGVRIKSGRWSRAHRQEIYDSRIITTRNLVKALAACKKPPQVFVSSSATGFYGNRGDELLDETSKKGQGFLADLTADWEAEATRARDTGTRVVLLRTAPVLSKRGGAFPELLKSFRPGFSSVLGSGSQWFPWIHIEDETGLIRQAIEDPDLEGPVNAASPDPRSNRELMKALARQLGKRVFLNVPEKVLQLALGEVADEMLLSSQRVIPAKALDAGYSFKFPTLADALRDLLGKTPNRQS